MSLAEELASRLRRLYNLTTQYRVDPGVDDWKRQALSTVVTNIDRYSQAVSTAIASGSADELRRSACRASSLRKGIGDMGVFEPPRDNEILSLVEQVSRLADEICLS